MFAPRPTSRRLVAAQAALTFALLLATTPFTLRRSNARGDDLVQDYVSARAWLDGESPYQPLNRLRERAGFEPQRDDVMVRHNPHPPGAVLLTVPFARLDFEDALRAVRTAQLAALALAWAVGYRLFAPPVSWWKWAAAGGLFGLWTPVWQGLDWGQPVGFLALAVAGIWTLGRAERPGWFGLALGLACTVRPFVALLAVVAAGWPRNQAAVALFAALVGGLLPFALTGTSPWEWLGLATAAGAYVEGCGSLPGVLGLGTPGGVVLFGLAGVVLGYLRWRGLDADATAALAATVAMLTYPLAWFQYDVSLVPVVAWVAARVGRSGHRLAFLGLAVFLLLRTVPDIIAEPGGSGLANALARNKGWLQVAARSALLLAVVAASRRRVSASGPS